MEDEGDEDWANNNEKSGESDDEDALKSVEDLKKSVDDLKKLVPCTIEGCAKVMISNFLVSALVKVISSCINFWHAILLC
jgi:hypothetical protein